MSTGSERWSLGGTTITSVVEEQTDGVPPEVFFPEASSADVLAHDWVRPRYADDRGGLGFRVQSFVVTTGTSTVLVDTCVGNDKVRTLPFWHMGRWPWLERLSAAGFAPGDIDVVVHTHTHADHVGWDTRWDGDAWVPTFPAARYLYTAGSLDWAPENDDPGMPGVYDDSIAPVFAAGLGEVVDDDHELGDGLALVPAPGHTPGNVAVSVVAAGGASALITGDFVHHPVQLAEPFWREIGDVDADLARATRVRMLAELAGSRSLVIGSHFPTAPAGHVVPDGDRWRFVPAPGAAVHGSPAGL